MNLKSRWIWALLAAAFASALTAAPARAWHVDLDIQGITSETQEDNPGGFVPLNGDRVQLNLSAEEIHSGDVTLCFDEGQSKVNIYSAVSGGTLLLGKDSGSSKSWSPGSLPAAVWVAGVAQSNGADVKLTLYADDAPTEADSVALAVYPELDSVDWEKYGDNLDLSDNENPGGGKRIFPDKKTHNDSGAADRKKVTVRAKLATAQAGVTVYFSSWDVDEPGTNSQPIDTNGSSQGGDNRATTDKAGTLSAASATTDASGEATVQLTVTMRPGDNFEVTASTYNGVLQAVTQSTVDGGSLPLGVKATNMLTVWRKLYVEFDTMDAPPANEPFGVINGTSASITTTQLTDNGSPGWPAAGNPLEGAVLDPAGNNPPNTVNNVDFAGRDRWEVFSNTANLVTVRTNYNGCNDGTNNPFDKFDNDGDSTVDEAGETCPMTPSNPSNAAYGLNTDDPKWRTDLNPPTVGDTLAGMNAYFDDAYILVEEQATGNTHPGFDWCRMKADPADTVDVPGDSSYWTVCVQWAYEHSLRKYDVDSCATHSFFLGDNDPQNEGAPSQAYSSGVLGNSGAIGSEAAIIYLENVRDHGFAEWSVPKVITHEVGHCLELEHATYLGDEIGFEEEKDGLMSWAWDAAPCVYQWTVTKRAHESPDRFSLENLDDLRSDFDD